ncbi:flagellar hook-basal body complex protein [Clostridium oceanicum]|uniref:Flagellar hook protein FlgE n=1 Tax=Clostridium oceanicum TaxID=1543 RepID=A0ABN1JU80_9CLOT
MLRSMYSGISGLKAQQTKLDVIGNNIANANTTAFKSQSIRFKDMLSQSMSEATGPQGNIGGTNPRQIGLGVQIGGIFTDTTTGNMQTTGRNLDVAIDGPGYFIVGRGKVVEGAGDTATSTPDTLGITKHEFDSTTSKGSVETMFTRDGSFILDEQGSLLTSDGLRVYGYANGNSIEYKGAPDQHVVTDPADELKDQTSLQPLVIPDQLNISGEDQRVQSFSIEQNGVIKATLANGSNVEIGQIAMASFKNPGGLTKTGKNLYTSSANSGDPIVRSSKGADDDNSKGYGDCLQGKTEMSNVDLAEQFTEMIVANRAFQACGKMITTGDEILQDLVNLKR